MNIDLIVVGKTDSAEVAAIVTDYSRRISRRARFGVVALPDVKRTAKTLPTTIMKAEGDMLLRQFSADDYVVLLDDKGVQYDSGQFASWLGARLAGAGAASGARRMVFVVGGAYGFSPEVRARSNESVSLSRMTFSHQIVRAIFAEQLYRAFTILAGEPYHHE
ncbi:MAG: 23S rRNA (pseudouridine(1915)-N(3))-methyltransferase RlmH [Alistipes sp.]|jgi:23S rRNA (pseudouridine1915-N3)-methyltransferase|nr:23S rRNA (pseudouridine(1915)-N(3))-methyltransferase RlmH [Alistipes sp.]